MGSISAAADAPSFVASTVAAKPTIPLDPHSARRFDRQRCFGLCDKPICQEDALDSRTIDLFRVHR